MLSLCALTPLSRVLKAIDDIAINGVLATYFQSIDVDIGRCTAVGDMSIWTSCFPPLDEQRFLGDKHKCHVFYINAVDIIVWITFTSDGVCVSSWERILFKCWHLKMKIRWDSEGGRPWGLLCHSSAAWPRRAPALPFRFLLRSRLPGLSFPHPSADSSAHPFGITLFGVGGMERRKGTWISYLYSPNTAGSS